MPSYCRRAWGGLQLQLEHRSEERLYGILSCFQCDGICRYVNASLDARILPGKRLAARHVDNVTRPIFLDDAIAYRLRRGEGRRGYGICRRIEDMPSVGIFHQLNVLAGFAKALDVAATRRNRVVIVRHAVEQPNRSAYVRVINVPF